MTDPVTTVRTVLDAHRVGDTIRRDSLCAEAMTCSFNADPDRVGPGRTVVGWAAVAEHLRRVATHWEQLSNTPISTTQNVFDPELVIVQFHFRLRHRESGEVLEGLKRQVWTVRNGIVTRVDEIFDAATVHAFQRYCATHERTLEKRASK